MYLSELFLQVYVKKESVLAALKKCDQELKGRLKQDMETEHILDYYLKENGGSSYKRFTELMDFMDVYCDVANEVGRKEMDENDIQIVNIAEEIKGAYHAEMCEVLPVQWTQEEQDNLETLCQAIEDIHNGKYIVFLKVVKGVWYTCSSLLLNDFEKQLLSFGYYEVKHKIIEF